MPKLISVFLVAMISIQLFSQTNFDKQPVVPVPNDDLAQLSALNAQFIQNFLHNDTVAHNTIIYKDFICIVGSGSVVNRNDYMKEWSHGYDPSVYRSFRMQNEFIRIFGNTALVRAETHYIFIKDGKEMSGVTIYTDTYIKLEGRWWCIQAQLTPKK